MAWMNGLNAAGDGGIYRTTNAFANPSTAVTFAQTFVTTATSTSNARGSLVAYKQGANPTVIYAASGEPSTPGTICNNAGSAGAIRKSTDGGVTWSAKLQGGGGFCAGQCFYNIGLAVTRSLHKVLDPEVAVRRREGRAAHSQEENRSKVVLEADTVDPYAFRTSPRRATLRAPRR